MVLDHIAKMDTDPYPKDLLRVASIVPFLDGTLDCDRTLCCIQRARKLHKKCVADRLYFFATMTRKDRPEEGIVLGKETKSTSFVLLRHCAVSDDVRKHNGGKSALCGIRGGGRHIDTVS